MHCFSVPIVFFIVHPGCLYCGVSFCAPSLYLYNWNSYSGFISSCLQLPRRTLKLHLYLFTRLPLRLISGLVNLSTLSLFTFLHWLAFFPPICYNSSFGRTLLGQPYETKKLLNPFSALRTVPISHLPVSPDLMLLVRGVRPGGQLWWVLPRLALEFPMAVMPVWGVTAATRVHCLVWACVHAPVLLSSGRWYVKGQSYCDMKMKPW